jgi:enterochelin esterase-like enzyme
MPYAVYLPAAYFANPDQRFPVLYMLHGAGGNYTEWASFGLTTAATRLMADGLLAPFIVIMPEGERSYWADGLAGDGLAWGDYIATDLVSYVDANYRTIPERNARAIGGESRGGFGALYLALTYTGVFGVAGGHSPSLSDLDGIEEPLVDEDTFAWNYDPVRLAEEIDPATAPWIWLDIGADDDWLTAVEFLDRTLNARYIAHRYLVYTGGHTQDYWSSDVSDYLLFYGQAFANGVPAALVRLPDPEWVEPGVAAEPAAEAPPAESVAEETPASSVAQEPVPAADEPAAAPPQAEGAPA